MPNDENPTTAHVQQNVMRRVVITDGPATCMYVNNYLCMYGCCFGCSYETVVVIVVDVDCVSVAVTI